jgi:hypothetical protein
MSRLLDGRPRRLDVALDFMIWNASHAGTDMSLTLPCTDVFLDQRDGLYRAVVLVARPFELDGPVSHEALEYLGAPRKISMFFLAVRTELVRFSVEYYCIRCDFRQTFVSRFGREIAEIRAGAHNIFADRFDYLHKIVRVAGKPAMVFERDREPELSGSFRKPFVGIYRDAEVNLAFLLAGIYPDRGRTKEDCDIEHGIERFHIFKTLLLVALRDVAPSCCDVNDLQTVLLDVLFELVKVILFSGWELEIY